MKINKLQLIFPPSSVEGTGIENSYIPNGILCLASFIKLNNPKIKIEVFDGNIILLEEILNNLDGKGTLVATSDLAANYKASKIIKEKAKQNGALTISGNHHANYLYHLGKTNHELIDLNLDFILPGTRGEFALNDLLNALNYNQELNISFLAYRNNDKFIYNNLRRKKIPKLSDLVKPDLSFINNFEIYFKNYQNKFGKFHNDEKRPININYIVGCSQGIIKPCTYCCLKDFKHDSLTPKEYAQEIQKLVEKGFNYFFETCNSFTSYPNFLEKLHIELKNLNVNNFEMQVYGRATDIDEAMVERLINLNVNRVIFGLDSGDDEILKNGIDKINTSAEQNIKASRLLNDAGIQIYACYVPGSLNETIKSLQRTYDQIIELTELKNTSVIEYTSLAPMPGSRAWNQIKNEYWKKHGKSDLIDVRNLAQSWVDLKVPNVTWDKIQDYGDKIKNVCENKEIIFGGYY
jgi:radical SAM superfamily enzyme YgiQ (UPF0313 family)